MTKHSKRNSNKKFILVAVCLILSVSLIGILYFKNQIEGDFQNTNTIDIVNGEKKEEVTSGEGIDDSQDIENNVASEGKMNQEGQLQQDTEYKDNDTEYKDSIEDMYGDEAYTNGIIDPQKVSTVPAINQDNNLILVNKKYVLDASYIPEVSEIEGNYLRDYVIEAYKNMKKAAAEDGVSLQIGSAYRSYDTQVNVFNSYLTTDSYENVITYSAFPGTSEHQTGLVIDFKENGSCDYNECFESTASGKWLKDNAYKYGFILRFPKNKEDITGYMFEPWHYRYVGVKEAKYIYDNNLTLEEYLL